MKKQTSGFTLLETVGVLVIIAILASVLAPNVIDGINRAYASAEEENLEVLSGKLREFVETRRIVPFAADTSWAPAIASISEFPVSDVLDNRRNQRRVLVVDPQFLTNAVTPFAGYGQTSGLANAPFSPRMMLISNLAGAVPAVPNTPAAFQAVWDQAPGAVVTEGPDLKIKRLHFGDLFHEVVLNNYSTSAPGYRLDANGSVAVPAATGAGPTPGELRVWVIDGTSLDLIDAPFGSASVLSTAVVQRTLNREFNTPPSGTVFTWSAP
ncbi:MAG: type II secretion system protein [Pseudomonadota bacterium]